MSEGLNERGQPICGHWEPMLGPCVCGDPDNHKAGGKYHPDEAQA